MRSMSQFLRVATLAASTVLIAATPAVAQNHWKHTGSSHAQMKTVNTTLDNAITVKTAKVGQKISATSTMSMTAPNGVKFPEDTKFLGKVTYAKQGLGSRPSRLSLRFDKARTPNGKTMPVKVTVIEAMPPVRGYHGMKKHILPVTSTTVMADKKVMQKPGLLHEIAMHSSAMKKNSATFTSEDNNFFLPAATQLRLAVAPRWSHHHGTK